MPNTTVVLASVPAVHLASFLTVPSLANRVAFGSSSAPVRDFPIGLTVYIHASKPPHELCKPGRVSWIGRLGTILEAVEHGRRSGKHPEPSVRPPSAEQDDEPFVAFWEVIGLRQLEEPIPLARFASLFHGAPPEWPVLATLATT